MDQGLRKRSGTSSFPASGEGGVRDRAPYLFTTGLCHNLYQDFEFTPLFKLDYHWLFPFMS